MTRFSIATGVLFFLATILSSCGNSETTAAESNDATTSADTAVAPESFEIAETEFVQEVTDASRVMLGTWKGEMSGKELTVVIEKIEGDQVSGYNLLGSNRRDLSGTFKEGAWDISCAEAFDAVLNEPGDDEWDGVFTIKFVGYQAEVETADGDLTCEGPVTGSEAMGTWTPNNGKASKDFTLVKE